MFFELPIEILEFFSYEDILVRTMAAKMLEKRSTWVSNTTGCNNSNEQCEV